jgi:hypothetical protein
MRLMLVTAKSGHRLQMCNNGTNDAGPALGTEAWRMTKFGLIYLSRANMGPRRPMSLTAKAQWRVMERTKRQD